MQTYGTRLKDCFQQELSALREETAAFARAFPVEADALRLGAGGSDDPHVALLLQSFAFLTGRVRYEMEAARAALPRALLQQLQPQLAASLPCMAVAQVQVRPDLPRNARLERGRQVSAPATDDQGRRTPCRWRTTSELPLLPLRVAAVDRLAPEDFPSAVDTRQVRSIVRVRVARLAVGPLEALGIRSLRLYIDSSHEHAYHLYEQLALHLVGVRVRSAGDDGCGRDQPGCAPQWRGFADDEAALPARADAHPGHRLLQEYFAFPEKFLFFDLQPLDLGGVEGDFELLLLLDRAADGPRRLAAGLLALNCVPLVNLYPQRIDPLSLDHTRSEYTLSADAQGHGHAEVHLLEELVSMRPDGSVRPLRPCFEMMQLLAPQEPELFYLLRHVPSPLGERAGTEAHISFVSNGDGPELPPPEVIGGRALCTNRRLPEQLRSGHALALEGPGPATALVLRGRPSPHTTPTLSGETPWALAAQLSLNHLSLSDGAPALQALKQVLAAHLGPAGRQGLRHVDGLRALSCRPLVRHGLRDGVRCFLQGQRVLLTLDRSGFEHGSPLLFAAVLRHFLALYAAVNTVLEVAVETTDSKGLLHAWPALAGAQVVL